MRSGQLKIRPWGARACPSLSCNHDCSLFRQQDSSALRYPIERSLLKSLAMWPRGTWQFSQNPASGSVLYCTSTARITKDSVKKHWVQKPGPLLWWQSRARWVRWQIYPAGAKTSQKSAPTAGHASGHARERHRTCLKSAMKNRTLS